MKLITCLRVFIIGSWGNLKIICIMSPEYLKNIHANSKFKYQTKQRKLIEAGI